MKTNLNNMNQILFVVDMVNGFCKEGAMADQSIMHIVKPIQELCEKIKPENRYFIADTHGVNDIEFTAFPQHCVKGEVESEVIDELKSIGKPFIVVVNSSDVNSLACKAVVDKLKEKYEVPVLAIAVNNMSEMSHISERALYEFPVSEININMPQWIAVLDDEHWLKKSFNQTIQTVCPV